MPGTFLQAATAETATFGSLTGAFLIGFPALFSMVNPLGTSLIFAEVTSGRTDRERRMLAIRVAIFGFLILVVSLWAGSIVLRFFGISLGALRIAGGLVVAIRAWDLLAAPETSQARKELQARQDGRTMAADDVAATAFFPLTMPFTVGPGSISVAIALSTEKPQNASWHTALAFDAGMTLAALAICAVVFVTYAGAFKLVGLLGRTGSQIVTRLSALILLCIGVQIVASGVQDVLRGVLVSGMP